MQATLIRRQRRKQMPGILAVATLLAGAWAPLAQAHAAAVGDWITTWAATPGPRWSDELPAPFDVPEVLDNQTVLQFTRISVGGDRVRVVLSNQFGSKPVTIGAASVALAAGRGIDAASMHALTWNGHHTVVIPPGAPMLSDPVELAAPALSTLAISFYLPDKTGLSTVHWDGRSTGLISAPGNMTTAASFQPVTTTQSRLFLSSVLVDARPASQSVVFLADSITDGYCSKPDANDRWPDHVAERLQAEGHPDVAVVNEAYSGDRVLTNGMGTDALSRFDMSVLSHPRVSTIVMMMGINDIGWPGPHATTPTDPEPTAEDIETGYQQIIARAHLHGLRFIAVTLTPFIDTFKGTPGYGYYTPAKEKIRRAVNQWIRTSGAADGVIDFDRLLDDPAHPGHLLAADDCGDHLHPNDRGYKAMADAVDLKLLVGH
ncbi:SGNH/GDSL hydrolase family protein [Lichenicoccus sp.]|uniref:SGNH/GDSL hydrolase family protein n=1 Tax=Lichenicoccus sp. TaxID=2781899 RepID=UPI003D0C99FD